MKQKQHARQKREAEAKRRKEILSPGGAVPPPAREDPGQTAPEKRPAGKPAAVHADPVPSRTPEEETREFLEYLDRYDRPVRKDEEAYPAGPARKRKAGAAIGTLNLEDGMPPVREAVERLRVGLQEMKVSRVTTVKLIHGYGSTGRGGKIREGVRKELAEMRRKKLIREYIPGEDFGPLDAASRRLAEREKRVSADPDYGRMNHGITIVVL